MNWLTLLLCTVATTLCSQTVPLNNPSFEGRPKHSQTPPGWKNWGFAGESPPDIQPNYEFGKQIAPIDGRTYLGMVARDNGTWEGVGQKLSNPLLPGRFYQIRFFVAKPVNYISLSRKYPGKQVNYDNPVHLAVLGKAKKGQERPIVLCETPRIEHSHWVVKILPFSPPDTIYSLGLAALPAPANQPYNGSILVDQLQLSEISPTRFEALAVETGQPPAPPLFIEPDPPPPGPKPDEESMPPAVPSHYSPQDSLLFQVTLKLDFEMGRLEEPSRTLLSETLLPQILEPARAINSKAKLCFAVHPRYTFAQEKIRSLRFALQQAGFPEESCEVILWRKRHRELEWLAGPFVQNGLAVRWVDAGQ